MTPAAASSPHTLATASGFLLGTMCAAMIVGAALGWALGSWKLGLLFGAVVGIPAGVFAVYRRYRTYFI